MWDKHTMSCTGILSNSNFKRLPSTNYYTPVQACLLQQVQSLGTHTSTICMTLYVYTWVYLSASMLNFASLLPTFLTRTVFVEQYWGEKNTFNILGAWHSYEYYHRKLNVVVALPWQERLKSELYRESRAALGHQCPSLGQETFPSLWHKLTRSCNPEKNKINSHI